MTHASPPKFGIPEVLLLILGKYLETAFAPLNQISDPPLLFSSLYFQRDAEKREKMCDEKNGNDFQTAHLTWELSNGWKVWRKLKQSPVTKGELETRVRRGSKVDDADDAVQDN